MLSRLIKKPYTACKNIIESLTHKEYNAADVLSKIESNERALKKTTIRMLKKLKIRSVIELLHLCRDIGKKETKAIRVYEYMVFNSGTNRIFYVLCEDIVKVKDNDRSIRILCYLDEIEIYSFNIYAFSKINFSFSPYNSHSTKLLELEADLELIKNELCKEMSVYY
ncbi:MAG: hypothetical protein ACRC4W_05290 [Treponemataceae bacterium]